MSSFTSQPYTVGVDVGGTNIIAGLVDADRQIISRNKVDTEADQGSDHVIQRIVKCVGNVLDDANVKPEQVGGVGLGIPGAVDPERGFVFEAVNLCWNDLQVTQPVSEQLNIPVTLDNDVNVGTWGEYVAGAGRGSNEMMGIFVGTGIGGGLILNGKLYHGHFKSAGEIGHIHIYPDAPTGMKTLEQLAGRSAVGNRLVRLVETNHPSSIREDAGSRWPKLRSKAFRKAMAADDQLVIQVLQETAAIVGVAIANTVTLLALDCVVVGGGLTEALDERWIAWIIQSFNNAVFPDECRQCRIVAGTLGDDAGLLGAALLASERFNQS